MTREQIRIAREQGVLARAEKTIQKEQARERRRIERELRAVERDWKRDRQRDYSKFRRRIEWRIWSGEDAALVAEWQKELDRFFPEFASQPLTKPS